jgi:hypothetical protein
MAVNNRGNFASILGGSVILGIQHEHLLRLRGKVPAWPVTLTAFDHHDHTARLAGIIGYSMFQCSVAPSHAK